MHVKKTSWGLTVALPGVVVAAVVDDRVLVRLEAQDVPVICEQK